MQAVQDVRDGKSRRVIILAPPGSAKSTYVTKLAPPFFMVGGLDVIGVSNTQSLAEDFSRESQGYARDNADDLGYSIVRDAAEHWQTDNGGHYRAAGMLGTITGKRADVAFIDDPIRTREEANSEPLMDKQWRWFMSSLRSRLKPKASIFLILTHWSKGDLAGRLLEAQENMWDVVVLPAQAYEEPYEDPENPQWYEHTEDPLGRVPGEWLWADDEYGYAADLEEALHEFETAGATLEWAALYQQRPTLAEGVLFKIENLEVIPALPVGGVVEWVRAWDLAATKKIGSRNPDWTVGVKMGRMTDGTFLVGDVIRFRGGPEQVEKMILATAKLDGHGIRISLPQDPGQAGKSQIANLTKMLAGYRVESSPESGDKATRAAAFAAQVNVGNVKMLAAGWNSKYRNELGEFGSSGKDDQVDASSRGFNAVAQRKIIVISPEMRKKAKVPRPSISLHRQMYRHGSSRMRGRGR